MGIKTARFIERTFGGILCWILSRFKSKQQRPTNPNNILIIQLWSIGETILTFPAMQAIKDKYPKSIIDVVTTKGNLTLFIKQGFYDNLLELDLSIKILLTFLKKNYQKYDLVFDMEEHYNVSAIMARLCGKYSIGYSHGIRAKCYSETRLYNDQQHVVQTFCDLADAKAPKELIKLNWEEYDVCLGKMLLSKNRIKSFIGMCVDSGGTSTSRRWPYFKELIKELSKKNHIIIFGSPKENLEKYKINDKVHTFQGSISEEIYLISKSKVFISNDTGPMHIAAAMGVKTIGLFGPNLPIRFKPYGKNNIALYHKEPCSPCINVHKGSMPECKDAKCMRSISVKEVLVCL